MTNTKQPPTLRTLTPKPKHHGRCGTSVEDYLLGEPYNFTRREQAVWRCVIVQAITDALSRSKKRDAIRHKREALAWLRGNSRDFRTVCEHAGFDPAYIRERVRLLLERVERHDALSSTQHPTRHPMPGQEAQSFSLRMPTMKAQLHSGISLSTKEEESE